MHAFLACVVWLESCERQDVAKCIIPPVPYDKPCNTGLKALCKHIAVLEFPFIVRYYAIETMNNTFDVLML